MDHGKHTVHCFLLWSINRCHRLVYYKHQYDKWWNEYLGESKVEIGRIMLEYIAVVKSNIEFHNTLQQSMMFDNDWLICLQANHSFCIILQWLEVIDQKWVHWLQVYVNIRSNYIVSDIPTEYTMMFILANWHPSCTMIDHSLKTPRHWALRRPNPVVSWERYWPCFAPLLRGQWQNRDSPIWRAICFVDPTWNPVQSRPD